MDELQKMADNQQSIVDDCDEIKHVSFSNVCNKFTVENGKREFIATISTNDLDRDGDIVDPEGIAFKGFEKNPVVLLNHDRYSLPIGKATWIKRFSRDGQSGLVAKGRIAKGTDKANDVFALMQEGILTPTSIGFGVRESRPPSDEEQKDAPKLRRVITRAEMFEFSIVGIPSNSNATVEVVSKMPAWMRPESSDVDLQTIEDKEKEIDLVDVVKLTEPVSLEALVPLEDAPMTEEEIAKQSAEDGAELYEVKVLGRVT